MVLRLTRAVAALVSTTALLILAVSVSAADTTVTVTGDTAAGENDPGGWLFNRDGSTSTPFEFNLDQASIGQGSLYVEPIGNNAADKFIGEHFLQQQVADVESISYDFLIGSGGAASDANHFYMNVYANFGESSPLKFYDCRYNIVPDVGSTSEFTTVTFDPTESYDVTTRGSSPYTCPTVPAQMDNLSAGATIRMFSLNVGDTSTNDTGLDGYLDKVVVTTNSMSTTFDFEPLIGPPTSKDECKNGGWQDFNNPEFNNQGECVSYVASNGGSHDNP